MVWACFAASGPEHLAVMDLTQNSSAHQNISESNMRTRLNDPNVELNDQDSDLKRIKGCTGTFIYSNKYYISIIYITSKLTFTPHFNSK